MGRLVYRCACRCGLASGAHGSLYWSLATRVNRPRRPASSAAARLATTGSAAISFSALRPRVLALGQGALDQCVGQFGTRPRIKIRWLSTVRGRFGLAVGDTMAYATAGVAFGGVRTACMFWIVVPRNASTVDNKTRVGWTVGGGVEHMWTRNWTIALEGLFVDLGRKTRRPYRWANRLYKTTTFSNQAVVGRLKLNYKW